MIARLISITPDAEKTMGQIARVSNPTNQKNENVSKLLGYCLKNGHFSVFEQAFMSIEVNTSIAISMQILRHKSFNFQQFSQRYADVGLLDQSIPLFELRMQDNQNRQNSIEDIDPQLLTKYNPRIEQHFKESLEIYNDMLSDGIAKECARFILPVATPTRLYISGTIRSWIHYIQARTYAGAQKEHRLLAQDCQKIFVQQFPAISKALGWS